MLKLKLGGKSKPASEAPEKQKAKKPKRIKERSTSSFALTLSVAVFLVVIAGSGVLYYLLVQQNHDLAFDRARDRAEMLSGRVSDRISLYRSVIQGMAAGPELVRMLEEKDGPGLSQRAQTLTRLLKDAWRIRILPAEWDQIDEQSVPHLSYASLDMLRNAERSGKPTKAEVHQFGSGNQHFALSVPILADRPARVVGVVHAAFPMELLRKMAESASGHGDYLELLQVSGDKSVSVAEGLGSGKGGVKDGGIAVAGTLWEVAYWSSGEVGLPRVLLFWGGPLIVVVLIGLVIFVQWKGLQRGLKSDLANVATLAEDVLKGKTGRKLSASIAECAGTLDMLVQLGQEAARNRRMMGFGGAKSEENDELLSGPPPEETVSEGISSTGEDAHHPEPDTAMGLQIPFEIFRNDDIRGVVGRTLTKEMVYQLGRAIGSEAYDRGQQTVIVARDGRLSSDELMTYLTLGLKASGRDVLDIGRAPAPMLYFATHNLGSRTGVMLTGSHNPKEYSGLKVVIDGEALHGEALLRLGQRAESGDLLQGQGARSQRDLVPDYIGRIVDDIHPARPMKVVVDCGNGIAGAVAPTLFRELGCEVVELFCEVDGNFPNHHPDPGRPENLQAMVYEVQATEADLGLAFDGDGDRIGVVDSTGNIIWPDRLMMLFAADVLSRQPGADVIYDVKSSRNLAGQILAHGGRPLMWKSGHSLMKAKLKETGALLAGGMGGHIYFQERWFGFDDALYAGARLLEILSLDARSTAEVFAELPDSVCTPELYLPVREGKQAELMDKVIGSTHLPKGAKLTTIDGMRVEFEEGWGLVRASGAVPALEFRFEADSEAGLEKIQGIFRDILSGIDPQLQPPF